jgi:tetratricopeptide (TPR) repeat protein
MKRALLPALAAVLLLSACADLQKMGGDAAKPAAVTPQITESTLRTRATEQLALGLRQYDAGDSEGALKNLTASLEHGMLNKVDQSIARKYLAMIHCVSNREAQCRDEFRKAFEINSDFSLTTAEDGHPIWGPVYRSVRTQLITEREAAQAASRPRIQLSRAEQTLVDGMVKFDGGDYEAAQRLFEAALKEGLKDKADQVKALKHIAFALCLRDKYRECRAAFVKIYETDPEFDLTPAEAGHPNWAKTFAAAKAQAKKAVVDRAAADKLAAEKAAKDKAAAEKAAKEKPPVLPAAAGAPKKN